MVYVGNARNRANVKRIVFQSYAACELGLSYVGLTMICFGVVNTLGSPLSGLLGKYLGRMPLCWIATFLNVGVLALMKFWAPSRHELYVFFIIPGVWGLADAIWQTQSGGKSCSCCHFFSILTTG